MKSTQKGIAAATLVTIIIAIIGFLILANVVTNFLAKSSDVKAERLCRDSVAFSAASAARVESGGTKGEISLIPVLCKTIDKKISEDPDTVKKFFADKMANCWEMFGEGRYKNSVFDNLPFFGGENRCFICYTTLLEEHNKFKEEDQGLSADEFGHYLATTTSKIKNLTYLDYIQSHGGPGNIIMLLDPNQGIKPGRGYALAYKAKASKCQVCEELIGGGAVTGLGGLASIAAFGIGTGGIGALIAGAGAVGYGAFTKISEGKRVFNRDSILVVDMANEELWSRFSKECTLERDIAGR